ncbi:hypothetical protein PY093_17450 [Cytobacillus sp. S13-E01]|nr:hypothetical protein [Cytobacillus sp. S13-E01]MDF0728426.1 hypothetical protein [Cytobacillus sp. S13-E01]
MFTSWEDFSKEQIDKVKRLMIRNDLQHFFAKDTKYQRFKYWGRFVKTMKDAEIIEQPPMAIMDIDDFIVVEFAETGNAAYFYTKETYERVISPRMHSHRG